MGILDRLIKNKKPPNIRKYAVGQRVKSERISKIVSDALKKNQIETERLKRANKM